MADLAGTTVGPYRLESLLGRGGMANVYFATHIGNGRKVALKLVRLEDVANGERRFLSEAQLLSNLNHPDIVRLYEFFESRGFLALAIEYVPGRCLDEILEGRKMLPAEALELFKKLLSPVAYLHEQGIVHRDIKPSNIRVMDNGEIKLLDFGIARTTGSKRLTRVGRVVGTPAYLSPEIRAGEEPKPTADVWALGMLLKECAEDWVHAQRPGIHGMKATPAERTFKRVLAKCLERRPEDRYRDAHAIERDLDMERLTGSLSLVPDIDRKTAIGIGIGALGLIVVLFVMLRGGKPVLPEPSETTTTAGLPIPSSTSTNGSVPIVGVKDGSGPTTPDSSQSSSSTGSPTPMMGNGLLPVRVALLPPLYTAELYIDGRDVGVISRDPTILQVTPGVHAFEVREDGKVICPSRNDNVEGQNTNVNFEMPIPN